jgi:hypothetical protein
MGMLRSFFADTEKSGTVGLHSHKTIDEKTYQIKNLLVIPEGIYGATVKYICLNVSSSMTLWELYDSAAKYFDKSPLKITLKRVTGNK